MKQKTIILILVLIAITASILYLEGLKPVRIAPGEAQVKPLNNMKLGKYPVANEIVNPSGFINVNNITVAELIGKKVILIDFWTYSCINCLRTLPYLNSWYEKYKDNGFVIIGVHTPEFQFEQNYDNVLTAVQKYNIKYPVVLDNNYSTWTAYGNLYWPHDYLIDIDGFIVHDHIGEGDYDVTEKNIQDALKERNAVLNISGQISTEVSKPAEAPNVDLARVSSPEIYFGATRNTYLGNGIKNAVGIQNITEPTQVNLNTLYLSGAWDFQNEYADNIYPGAKIIFRYNAKNVHFVASAKENTTIQVLRDGKPLGNESGKDVSRINGSSIVTINEPRLYTLVEDPMGYGEHTLEIIVENPGLHAFTFTFG
jgi:thiol-disulfide isomerase/thioredoxin